jgi:hypothetical protein
VALGRRAITRTARRGAGSIRMRRRVSDRQGPSDRRAGHRCWRVPSSTPSWHPVRCQQRVGCVAGVAAGEFLCSACFDLAARPDPGYPRRR